MLKETKLKWERGATITCQFVELLSRFDELVEVRQIRIIKIPRCGVRTLVSYFGGQK